MSLLLTLQNIRKQYIIKYYEDAEAELTRQMKLHPHSKEFHLVVDDSRVNEIGYLLGSENLEVTRTAFGLTVHVPLEEEHPVLQQQLITDFIHQKA
jgi:hypothetical protein